MLRLVKEPFRISPLMLCPESKFCVWFYLLLCSGVLFLFSSLAFGASEDLSAEQRPNYELAQISIYPGIGKASVTFQVELANTPVQHRFGLMFSPDLRLHTGMLFIFDDIQSRIFWMKNTPIPLDLLFFDNEGRLVSIIKNAKPYSLVHLKSAGPAQYVLEISGGESSRLGFGTGTYLQLPLLSSQIR